MDDDEGKGAAAAGASESTGVDVSVDVHVQVQAADVQAKASTMHDARRTPTRTTQTAAITAAAPAESSTSTSTTSTSTSSVAAGERDHDGDDAGPKMNHHTHNPYLHGSGHYDGGRHPLPMSLPARSSSNSFTPINTFSHRDDHHHQSAPTLPPIGSINSLPPPQSQASRQRTSLPTARPSSSTAQSSNVSYYPGHTDGRLLPSNFGINPSDMAQYALLPPEPKAFQRTAPKKV